MRFPLTLLILLILGTCVRAQKSEDLREDSAIFEQQAQRYQKWLDRTGLGQYLKYRELDVKEKQLDVYLEFKSNNLDTIISQWRTLKAAFEAEAPISLERQLFYKAVNLMEVRQSALSVQLYDTYDLSLEPLFFRAVYFDDDQVKVEESNPKSPIKPIGLQPRVVNGKPQSVADYQAQFSREKVYDCIIAYANSRYRNRGTGGKDPEVRVLEYQDILRFEVIDLRREVLPDGSLDALFRKFGKDWAKRELITFQFAYEPTTTGIRITGDIDGKVGSGFYNSVPRGGYQPMENDYDADLKAYIDAITVEIKRFLQSCP